MAAQFVIKEFSDRYRNTLTEFRARVEELADQALHMKEVKATDPVIAALAPFMKDWQKMPNAYVDPKVFDFLKRGDRRDENELVRLLRHFSMEKEPSSIRWIVEGAKLHGEPKFAAVLDTIKKRFDVFPRESGHTPTATIDGKMYEMTEDRMKDFYMNGHLFHAEKGKRTKYLEIKASDLDDLGYSLFMRKVIVEIEAVFDVYVALRDAEWIHAIANEPTIIRKKRISP